MGFYVIDINILIPVFSLLGLVCIISNALVCYVFLARKISNSVIKYYIFSLAITDILTGAICIPIYLCKEWILFYKIKSLLPELKILNSVLLVSESLLATSSILHLCVMAFDRALSVSKPLYHRVHLRRKSSAMKLLLIPWLLAPLYAILFFKLVEKPINWAILVAITVIVPGLFIMSCYAVLFHKIKKRNRRFSVRINSKQIREKRTIKTFLVIVIAFLVCWMPVFILSIYYTVNIQKLPNNIHIFFKLSSFLQYLNSACNPFIYAAYNPVFRAGLADVLTRVRNSMRLSFSQTQEETVNNNGLGIQGGNTETNL